MRYVHLCCYFQDLLSQNVLPVEPTNCAQGYNCTTSPQGPPATEGIWANTKTCWMDKQLLWLHTSNLKLCCKCSKAMNYAVCTIKGTSASKQQRRRPTVAKQYKNNDICPIMPRYAKVHHAVRAIYAKAEEAPQNQTNHLSGGMSFFGSVILMFFFSDSQSPELITLATQINYWLLINKLKVCIVETLQQVWSKPKLITLHSHPTLTCLSCYHKKIETVDRMKSQAQDMSASLDY